MAVGEPGGSEDDPEYSGDHPGFLGRGVGGRLGYKSGACLQLEQAAGAWDQRPLALPAVERPRAVGDTRTRPDEYNLALYAGCGSRRATDCNSFLAQNRV